jgi:hypothetical protein
MTELADPIAESHKAFLEEAAMKKRKGGIDQLLERIAGEAA